MLTGRRLVPRDKGNPMNPKFHSRSTRRINQTERNRHCDSDYGLLEPRQLLAGVLFSTVAAPVDGPTSLVYHVPDSVPIEQRIELLRTHLEFGPNESLRLIDLSRDELGFAHFKYQQLYAGHPVETAVYTIHAKDGQIMTLSGDRVSIPNVAIAPQMTEQAALRSALAHVGAETYVWQSNLFGSEPSLDSLNEQPTGELVYFQNSDGEFGLTYKFDIFAMNPMSRAYIYVDANSGGIQGSLDRIHEIDTAATGTSLYNGDVAFTADEDNGEFRLRQAIFGVETYDMNSSYDYMDAVDFVSDTTEFIEPDVQVGVQAHWGTEQVYEYYFTEHLRDSFDNAGTTLVSYVSFGQNFANAFWNGSFMTYGDGDGVTLNPLVSLDIVGHELTHGVTENSAGLIYSYESGALNESFSDIFGKSVENFATGSNNWLLGDEIGIGGSGAIRNMEDPNQFNDPDTYLGDFWWTNPGDNGGVHTNSGVQNKWFQLLTDGGSGVNDNGDTYDVAGIGIGDAGDIAYRNLTVYLTPDSQFIDARTGSLQAAVDLFGDGSMQQQAVEDAWDAVGVYGLQPPVEFITRVDPLVPDGSMIYQTSKTNHIDGDLGIIYRMDLDPAQKMSLVLTGSSGLAPSITILDGANKEIALATAQGTELVLQSINIKTAGTYQLIVSSGGVDGNVKLDIWLNAALENEGFDPSGASNDTIATAQSLEHSATKLAGHGQRMAVLGDVTFVSAAVSEDFESGFLDQHWTTSTSTPTGHITVSDLEGAADGTYALLMDQFDVEGQPNLNEAIYSIDVTAITSPVLTFAYAEWNDETDLLPVAFEGSVDGDGVSISDDGVNWYTILTGTNSPAGQWIQASFDLAPLANEHGLDLGANLQIKFQQFGRFRIDADGRGYDAIRIAEGDTVAVSDGFESGVLDQQWTVASSDPGGQILVTNAEGAAEGDYALLMYQSNEGTPNLNEAVYHVDLSSIVDPRLSFWQAEWNDETNVLPASFAGSVEGDGVSISDDGVNWHTILTGTDYPAGEWVQESFDLVALSDQFGLALDANFQIKFQQFDNFTLAQDGRGYDGIQIIVPGSGADWYSFDVAQDQVTTLAATALRPGMVQLDLFDAAGTLVQRGSTDDGVNSFAHRFVGQGATYYARVTGTTSYSLVVTRGADFDVGLNDTIGSSQDITGLQGVLGFVADLDQIGAEPDNALAADNISDFFRGVTLSNAVTGGDIFAAAALGFDAPTGDNVFAPAAFQASGFRAGVNELRADFVDPQAYVSIDVGADDDTDVGFLRAYDVDGNFLEEVVSRALTTGESETLVITRGIAEIGYVIAAGVRGDNTPFDNLIFELENFDEDVYSFEVAAGEEISLDVLLPGGGDGLFDNGLSTENGPAVTIELIDSNGFVVQTENSSITYVSGDAGTYVVRVMANSGYSGEYFLFRDIEAGIVAPAGIDFGPPDSPIFEDYAGVSDESYSVARGYGWLSTVGLTSFTDQRGGELLGDKIALREGSFDIDVDNGAYTVDVLFGAVSNKTDQVGITVNGVEDVFRPLPGPNVVRSYPVNITDGQLNLEFTGAPGLDRVIRLAGIRLTPMDLRPFNGGSQPGDQTKTADGVIASAILPGSAASEKLDGFVPLIQPQTLNGFTSTTLAGSLVLDRQQTAIRDFGMYNVRTPVESLPEVATLNKVLEEALLDL